jgi:DNA polymerase III epsilon subunit-like protein
VRPLSQSDAHDPPGLIDALVPGCAAMVDRTWYKSFEYEHTRFGVRYAAADGAHDDCVCALALAVMRRGIRKSSGSTEQSPRFSCFLGAATSQGRPPPRQRHQAQRDRQQRGRVD